MFDAAQAILIKPRCWNHCEESLHGKRRNKNNTNPKLQHANQIDSQATRPDFPSVGEVLNRKLPDNWDECLPKLTEEDAGKAGTTLPDCVSALFPTGSEVAC